MDEKEELQRTYSHNTHWILCGLFNTFINSLKEEDYSEKINQSLNVIAEMMTENHEIAKKLGFIDE